MENLCVVFFTCWGLVRLLCVACVAWLSSTFQHFNIRILGNYSGDPETLAAIDTLLGVVVEQQQDTRSTEEIDLLAPPEEDTGGLTADEVPEIEPGGRLRWEPVNVVLLEEALRLDAFRRVRLSYYYTFHVLLSIRRRVVNV